MLVSKDDLISLSSLISRHLLKNYLQASVRWPLKGAHFGKVYIVKIIPDKSGNAERDFDGRIKVACPNTKHRFYIKESDIHFEEA